MGRKVSIGREAGVWINTGSETVNNVPVPLNCVGKEQSTVILKASNDNPGTVYVGGRRNLTAGTANGTDGFPLYPGESIELPITPGKPLYAIGSSDGQTLHVTSQSSLVTTPVRIGISKIGSTFKVS